MTENPKPIVVFDTQAVTQATICPDGYAADGLRLMDEEKIEVYMSNRLRAEYEKTLDASSKAAMISKNHRRLQNVTPEAVRAQLTRFDEKANRLLNPPNYVNFSRDENDAHVLNLAIHVKVDFIVSLDNDLLNLNQNKSWQEYYPDIKVVKAEQLRDEISLFHEQSHKHTHGISR